MQAVSVLVSFSPDLEVRIDGIPVREPLRQHAPLTAAFENVANRTKHLIKVYLTRLVAFLAPSNKGLIRSNCS